MGAFDRDGRRSSPVRVRRAAIRLGVACTIAAAHVMTGLLYPRFHGAERCTRAIPISQCFIGRAMLPSALFAVVTRAGVNDRLLRSRRLVFVEWIRPTHVLHLCVAGYYGSGAEATSFLIGGVGRCRTRSMAR